MAPRRRGWDDPWREYPASTPRPTDDGIATTKQRGAMADTWWSRRLLEVLDASGLRARMQRGRHVQSCGSEGLPDAVPMCAGARQHHRFACAQALGREVRDSRDEEAVAVADLDRMGGRGG